ncbi:uncharacterized protein METZ01_LOCUS199313, partial [marine metagenome]
VINDTLLGFSDEPRVTLHHGGTRL